MSRALFTSAAEAAFAVCKLAQFVTVIFRTSIALEFVEVELEV